MIRTAQVTQAVSAMRKARAAPSFSPEPASMRFLIHGDNGGGYHWTIVSDGGETLVRSGSFTSHEEAEQAARIVHGGASRASFGDRSGDAPPSISPRAAMRQRREIGQRREIAWTPSAGWMRAEASADEAVTR